MDEEMPDVRAILGVDAAHLELLLSNLATVERAGV